MSGKILRMSGRAPAFLPHEEAEMRDTDLAGLIVDHIDGVVAQDLIERTQEATASDYWSLQS
jgi:hypothetical protein